jgi:predicted phosphodiesterase
MSDATGLLPKQIRSALEELGHQGYRVETAADVVRMHRTPPPSETMHEVLFDGDHYRFAVVSDTHMGSKHERLEELHVAYDRIQAEGITTVYHPGDLVCGYGIFPNQVSTVKLHTYEEQVEYAALNYPARDGVTTEIIAGNHDIEGAFGRIGANPVEAVCNRRSDMVYGGAFHTTYKLAQGTRIYMLHPKGGTAYAVSYKAQKIAEGFEAGSKPNVVLLGHWHKRGDFEWRSVQLLLAGCFEGGGSFGARLGLGEPAVGFHIVDLWIADDGSVVRWRPEWFKFFPGRGFAHAT